MSQSLKRLQTDLEYPTSNISMLTDPDTFATTLLVLLGDVLDEEFVNAEGPWSPEAIRMEVWDRFRVTINDVQMAKILAGVMVMTQMIQSGDSAYFHNLATFLTCTNGLNGNGVDFSYSTIPTPEELAWGVIEAEIIQQREGDVTFSVDVAAYIDFILKENGVAYPPHFLRVPGAKTGDDYDVPEFDLTDEIDLELRIDASQNITDYVTDQLKLLYSQISSLQITSGSTLSLLGDIATKLEDLESRSQLQTV